MLLRHEAKNLRRAAFTLMEMLVVVAIIVALAGVGGFFLLGQLASSQKDVARLQSKTLAKACETYNIRHNGAGFPDSLQTLLGADDLGNPPLLESSNALRDPWGKEYQYDKSGAHNKGMKPDVWAVAPDGTQCGNWAP